MASTKSDEIGTNTESKPVFPKEYKDGILYAGSLNDNKIMSFDPESGSQVFQPYENHSKGVWALEVMESRMKHELFSAGRDRCVTQWKTHKNNKVEWFGSDIHEHWVTCLANIQNRVLATGSDDRTVKFWGLDNHEQVYTSLLPDGHLKFKSGVYKLCTIGNDKLSVGTYHGDISIYDIKTMKLISEIHAADGQITSLCSINGSTLLSSAQYYEKVQMWDIRQPSVKAQGLLKGHIAPVWDIKWNPITNNVYTCGADGNMKKWSLSYTASPLFTFEKIHEGQTIYTLALCGEYFDKIASGGDSRKVLVHNCKTHQKVSEAKLEGNVHCLAYAPVEGKGLPKLVAKKSGLDTPKTPSTPIIE